MTPTAFDPLMRIGSLVGPVIVRFFVIGSDVASGIVPPPGTLKVIVSVAHAAAIA